MLRQTFRFRAPLVSSTKMAPTASPLSKPTAAAAAAEGKLAEERSAKSIYIGPVVRLQAWYLGVDPRILARYGDGQQLSRLFRFLMYAGLMVGVGFEMYVGYAQMNNRHHFIKNLEENRKRFYGHDFDQPMGDITRNFGRSDSTHYGEKNVILDADERTGLMHSSDERMIAPAKYERDVRQVSPQITDQMMARVSNLSKMQSGYMPNLTQVAEMAAPSRQ